MAAELIAEIFYVINALERPTTTVGQTKWQKLNPLGYKIAEEIEKKVLLSEILIKL